jgi:hypothetical protein
MKIAGDFGNGVENIYVFQNSLNLSSATVYDTVEAKRENGCLRSFTLSSKGLKPRYTGEIN